MNFEQAKEILTNLSAAIVAQNRELMEQMDEPDFDPGTKLDNTKNNAGYLLTDFFDALKCFPHGQVPCEVTDSVITTTDDLIAKIRKKYGYTPEVERETIRTGQAFRDSKRLWRIKNPIRPIPQEDYERMLDESLCVILRALDDLNYELNLLPQETPAEPPRQKRRDRPKGKGPQSDYKRIQREAFVKFLERRPITPSISKISRAHQCWLENKSDWDNAAAVGTGYYDYKKLARAI